MKKLPPHDERFLDAAEGWLGLGDHLSANEELGQTTPELRAHPDVMPVRLQIYWRAEKWDTCVEIAGALVSLSPSIPDGWIGGSFALHELKRTQEAYELLMPAKDKFPTEHVIPCNLACYSAQLNQLKDAGKWFKQAMMIDEHNVKRTAVTDPDLEPLWNSMGGTMWKRE